MDINNLQNKKICAPFVFFLILTILSVLLDITYYRQLFALIFIIILPGLCFIYLFGLDKLGIAERSVLTIGLSIAFLIIFGLILNELCLLFGYTHPLSEYFLVIAISLVLLVVFILALILNNSAFSDISLSIKLSVKEKTFLILLVISLLLIIVGSQVLILYDNNYLLLVAIILISVTIALITLKGTENSTIYPIAITIISFSLLTMYWLRWDHILGHDVHLEYYTYYITCQHEYWSILMGSTLDSCLSISLLPAIFKSLLNVNNDEQLFKGVYALICSFTPLVVFVICKRYIQDKYAFLAGVFYASQGTFISAPGSPRTNLCVLFVGLIVMVLFLDEVTTIQKNVLSIIFLAGIIFSHYTTTYIFFFMVAFTYIGSTILKRYVQLSKLSYTFLLLFAVLIFLWFGQLTGAPFDSGVRFIDRTISTMSMMFVEEAKSPQIALLYGHGMEGKPIVSWILWVNTWASFILIGISIVYLIIDNIYHIYLKRPNIYRLNSETLINRFDVEFVLFSIASSILLAASILIPQLSTGYEISRILIIIYLFFAPLFVFGGIIVAYKLKGNPSILLLPIVIITFMGATGALHSICGVGASLLIESDSPSTDWQLVQQTEISAAQWLALNRGGSGRIFSTDYHGYRKLISQGKISYKLIDTNMFTRGGHIDGYLFLHAYNVLNGRLFSAGKRSEELEISEYGHVFSSMNKLYTSGGSEIWRSS